MPHLHDVHGNNSWDANHFHYFRILLALAWIIGDARTLPSQMALMRRTFVMQSIFKKEPKLQLKLFCFFIYVIKQSSTTEVPK